MQLPQHIANRIAAWVAETPTSGGHVDNEAARYGGVSLMGTIGSVWLMRPDGTLWEVDDDTGRPLKPLPSNLETIALVAGSKRHFWLHELVPLRPQAALDCPTCDGRGLIGGAAFCDRCNALGWSLP